MTQYVPTTPGGTPVPYGAGALMGRNLWAKTREQAIANLLVDAQHMPYKSWGDFEHRGYTIQEYPDNTF